LIVGDSHYGKEPDSASPDFTSEIVSGQFEKPITFFTRIAGLVQNRLPVSSAERREFWSSIAFYNYLQSFAGEGPGVSVAYEPFAKSDAAFVEVLKKLSPDVVVVLGHRVWAHMGDKGAQKDAPLSAPGVEERYKEAWRYPTSNRMTALVFHVKHPSRGFTFGKFHPLHRDAVRRVRKTSG
jgi:hypothetical protein